MVFFFECTIQHKLSQDFFNLYICIATKKKNTEHTVALYEEIFDFDDQIMMNLSMWVRLLYHFATQVELLMQIG